MVREDDAPDFTAAVADAAKAGAEVTEQDRKRRAQAMLKEGIAALAETIERETGFASGVPQPWVYKAKPKAAYGLWQRVIPMLIDVPKTLDMSVVALAKMLDENEPNFTVTREMPMSRFTAARVC